MLGNHFLCSRAKVPSAGVVPQSLPQAEHSLFRGIRQSLNRRISGDEPVKVRDHRGNLRLLKHEFTDQHKVRINPGVRPERRPPRQIAPVAVIPPNQIALEQAVVANNSHF
jgi:hypothetical protein